jgi:hypothetical protein
MSEINRLRPSFALQRNFVKCQKRTLAVQPLTTELDGELPVRRRRFLLAIRRAPDATRPDLCQPIV